MIIARYTLQRFSAYTHVNYQLCVLLHESDAPLGAGASAIITGREGLCLLVRPK